MEQITWLQFIVDGKTAKNLNTLFSHNGWYFDMIRILDNHEVFVRSDMESIVGMIRAFSNK
jgi:hypothetical protein